MTDSRQVEADAATDEAAYPPRITRQAHWTDEGEVVAMATMLLSAPMPAWTPTTLIIPTTGMGGPEEERVRQGVVAWNTDPLIRLLLLSGSHKAEPFYQVHTQASLRRDYGLVRADGTVVSQKGHADHTEHQARWTVEQMREHGATEALLVAPAYHMLRQVLTMLAAIIRQCGVDAPEGRRVPLIPIIPLTLILPPSSVSIESKMEMWDLIPGETRRISDYQAGDDVASFEQFRTYLDALYPLLLLSPQKYAQEPHRYWIA